MKQNSPIDINVLLIYIDPLCASCCLLVVGGSGGGGCFNNKYLNDL